MTTAYSMALEDGAQSGEEDSFVGGRPKLPKEAGIPRCSLCASDQSFFFQVAFPSDHGWAGLSLAVFACTSCADESYLIPEMLPGPLPGADIPAGFLSNYQRNFRFEVFETHRAEIVAGYRERVRFQRIRLGGGGPSIGQVGGLPSWVLEDESPGTYASSPMVFLLQLRSHVEFGLIQGAPPQMEIGLLGDPEPAPFDFYKLFIGNTLYLFGTEGLARSEVYAVTQVD